jgi:hypothetical protein
MNENKELKIAWIWVFIFSLVLFQISCQKDEVFIGYNDILVNSPMLLWDSSIEELKNNYPNIEEFGVNNMFTEYNLDGQIEFRIFHYFNNELFMVAVSYGKYSNDRLDLLRKDLQKKYGTFTIEDSGTIEAWYLELNEYNEIVFLINKLENNTVRCSYINPSLRDESLRVEHDKTIIRE